MVYRLVLYGQNREISSVKTVHTREELEEATRRGYTHVEESEFMSAASILSRVPRIKPGAWG